MKKYAEKKTEDYFLNGSNSILNTKCESGISIKTWVYVMHVVR